MLPVWSRTAGQRDQLGFFLPMHAPLQGTCGRVVAPENGLQSLRDESLFDANDRATADLEGVGNLLVGGRRLWLTAIQFE